MPRSGSLTSWLPAQAVKPAEPADILGSTSENLTGILARLENNQVREPEWDLGSILARSRNGDGGTVPLDAG